MATLEALYITVCGHTQRLTTPHQLEIAIREIIRDELVSLGVITEEQRKET